MTVRRFGLSFASAPPAPVHPNRTDVACFVGSVARRRAAEVTVMPELLRRWLAAASPVLAALPLAGRRVSLRSAAALLASLRAALAGSSQPQATLARLGEAFEAAPPAALAALLEACRTLTPLPAALLDELAARGFHPGGHLAGEPLAAWLRIQNLHDLPVPIESFESFDALFAWDARPVLDRQLRAGDPLLCTPLGAAVRAFFGEGGQRCWVIRSGDPVALFDSASDRFGVLSGVDSGRPPRPLPGRRAQLRCIVGEFRQPAEALQRVRSDDRPLVSSDPAQWCGLDHVFGLAEVSVVCLPDLPDAVAHRAGDEAPAAPPPGSPAEFFRDCAVPAREPPRPLGRLIAPPATRDDGLHAWIALLRHALALLDNGGRAFNRRDVQLLASLPLAQPERGAPLPDDWLAWMTRHGAGAAGWWSSADELERGEPFARLQLAYPWLVTRDSADCAGGLEAPEGTLAGVLARNALARGGFRSAAMLPVQRYLDAEPALDLVRALDHALDTPAGPLALAERVCLIGASPRGPRLWSDASFASRAAWRPGPVRRLVNVVINAARRAGEEFAFEPNGELLWAQLRARLGDLGRELAAAGALATDVAGGAFVVRCGRDTMTQADLDAGRLMAEIELVPATPVQRITVVLALRDAQSPAAQPQRAVLSAA